MRPRDVTAVLRWAVVLVLLPVMAVAVLAVDIWRFGQGEGERSADAAIVLGAAAWNGRPSPVFRERIHHALRLYEEGRVSVLIFTGGRAAGEPLAESVAGARYAVARGLDMANVFCEVASADTWNNVRGAAAVAEAEGIERVLVVSDPLHLRRAVTMVRDMGLDAEPSPTPTSRFRGTSVRLRFLWEEIWQYAAYLLQRPFLERAVNPDAVGPCLPDA